MVIIDKPVRGLSQQSLNRFVLRARKAAKLAGRVNVLLTSNRQVRSLNGRFRGQNKPTDVLSFPAWPIIEKDLAGDIVVSSEIAAENADQFGHSPADEVKILVLHGVLHLAGYDHESDQGQMERTEARLRRELGLRDTLTGRAARAGRNSKHEAARRHR